ncbi:MAG: type IX secretion system protein PorQ [Bacteroidales bacterium]|nr:type IX secretion system protein PorQ [Bacteroidales bacterium]
MGVIVHNVHIQYADACPNVSSRAFFYGMRAFRIALFCMVLFSAFTLKAQVAGLTSYAVLDIPRSPRSASLGMDFLALPTASLDATLDNPSLIDSSHSGHASIGYMGLSRGTNFGHLAYGRRIGNVGNFVFGLSFCSFGSFDGYNEEEVSFGKFYASDYIFSIGWGRAIDSNFSIGASFKPIYSHYESYSAFAISFDVAVRYVSTNRLFAATLIGRSIGAQIVTFDNKVERMPFELAAGLSYKLKNAPFRFFFNAAELQRWDLRYNDALNPTEETDPFTGEITRQSDFAAFADKMGRHIQVGVELNIGSSFFARVGYNYRKAVEMKAADVLNVSGFSFGIGFTFKGFEFAYAHNNYHLWQAPNYISITTDLNRFFGK